MKMTRYCTAGAVPAGQATLNPRFQRPPLNPRHMRQFVTCEVTSGAPKKRARARSALSG